MNENVDSIFYDSRDFFTPIYKIAENTEPINLVNWDLAWWSFHIAIFSLIAGIIAAIYSYRGYKFQRISAERLEKLIPGQISYYEVICCLINNILDLEAIFFGKSSFKEYPTKLILSISSLPEDLIDLNKYEKNKQCYEEAFKLKIAWRNYNVLINNLIQNISIYEAKEIDAYVNYFISLSKSYIILIQKFERILVKHSYLEFVTSTNERIAFFILDRFIESVSELQDLKEYKLDTRRTNLGDHGSHWYDFTPYLPNLISTKDYLKSEHSSRLKIFNSEKLVDDTKFYADILNAIKDGDFDFLGDSLILPSNITFSSLDITHFKNTYYNFIEPIIIGHKRYEYSVFLKR